MLKHERLEITVSVLATDDCEDDAALDIARQAVKAATAILTATLPTKRFVSSLGIGSGIKRTVRRRDHGPRRTSAALAETPDDSGRSGPN